MKMVSVWGGLFGLVFFVLFYRARAQSQRDLSVTLDASAVVTHADSSSIVLRPTPLRVGELRELTCDVTNGSDSVWTFDHFEASCRCLKPHVSWTQLRPGETGQVSIAYAAGSKPVDSNSRVTMFLKDRDLPIRIDMVVSVRKRLTALPASEPILLTADGDESRFQMIVESNFDAPEGPLTVESDVDWISVVSQKKVSTQTFVRLQLNPANLNPGRHLGILAVTNWTAPSSVCL
jgi:hypothetical protein